MRAFIAVGVPADVRSAIATALEPVRRNGPGVRWVEPDAYHITLQFLGTVSEERVDAVGEALVGASAEAAAFHIRLRSFGAFPTARRPRVLWVGVDDVPELYALQHDIERRLEPVGFTPEARPFHPHITVARTERGARTADAAATAAALAAIPFDADVRIDAVELMESRLQRNSARYATVRRCDLGGGWTCG